MTTGPGGVGGRHTSRERALGLLYEAEQKEVTLDSLLGTLPAAPDRFAGELVSGVGSRLVEIDALLIRFARNWSIDRMPALDRAILRIGVFELLARPDVPTAVVIDEAVELAKQYSTEESGKFVNGMLARIADEVRGGDGG